MNSDELNDCIHAAEINPTLPSLISGKFYEVTNQIFFSQEFCETQWHPLLFEQLGPSKSFHGLVFILDPGPFVVEPKLLLAEPDSKVGYICAKVLIEESLHFMVLGKTNYNNCEFFHWINKSNCREILDPVTGGD